MQEEEMKRLITRSGKGGRKTRGGKEMMGDLKRERRKECKRRKAKDGLPEVGEEEGMQWAERKGWMTRSGRVGRNAIGGKERMDDPKWKRRKECNGRKGKDGGSVGRNAMVGKDVTGRG